MASWRDIKSSMLANVHAHFLVPAVYWTHTAGTPLAVNVRDHTTQVRLENDDTWVDAPGYFSLSPSLVFDAAEISNVLQDAYVVMSATEVYLTKASRPMKDGYIPVEVVTATTSDIAKMMAGLDLINLDPVWDGILP